MNKKHTMCNHVVYVLKCSNNKYYVGKTTRNVSERFNEHLLDKKCAWTKLYEPLFIIEIINSKSNFLEDNITKEYMMNYGIDNVRGGSYSNVNLLEYQLKSLNHEFLTYEDKCYICHQNNHLSPHCPNKKRKFSFNDEDITKNNKKIKNEDNNCVKNVDNSYENNLIIKKIELFFNTINLEMSIDAIFSYDNSALILKKKIVSIILNEIMNHKKNMCFIEQNINTNDIQDIDIRKNIIKILFIYEKLKAK